MLPHQVLSELVERRCALLLCVAGCNLIPRLRPAYPVGLCLNATRRRFYTRCRFYWQGDKQRGTKHQGIDRSMPAEGEVLLEVQRRDRAHRLHQALTRRLLQLPCRAPTVPR